MVRPCGPRRFRLAGFFLWRCIVTVNQVDRVVAFIDGFNLYHSIHDLHRNHLKWVDLWKLSECFVKKQSQTLIDVYYFSAYAVWMPDQARRHRAYVKALISAGVTPVMASFKEKDRKCRECGHKWKGHEEKETDVNISVAMLNGAYHNDYDHAYLVSRDSDLTPVVRTLRTGLLDKRVTVIAPPKRGHSSNLLQIDPPPLKAKISISQLERCLFPANVTDAGGNLVARRPQEYDPPGEQ